MEYAVTPTQAALDHIARIEKRYKSSQRRREAISKESRFWHDYWKALGLIDKPEYMQALQTYARAIQAYE